MSQEIDPDCAHAQGRLYNATKPGGPGRLIGTINGTHWYEITTYQEWDIDEADVIFNWGSPFVDGKRGTISFKEYAALDTAEQGGSNGAVLLVITGGTGHWQDASGHIALSGHFHGTHSRACGTTKARSVFRDMTSRLASRGLPGLSVQDRLTRLAGEYLKVPGLRSSHTMKGQARAAGQHPCQALTSSRDLERRAGVACLGARRRLEAVGPPSDKSNVPRGASQKGDAWQSMRKRS
jgi:hypothetical protein